MEYSKHQKTASFVAGILMVCIIISMLLNNQNSYHWKTLFFLLVSYLFIMFPNFWKYVIPMTYRKDGAEVSIPNPDFCLIIGWGGILFSIFAYVLLVLSKIKVSV